HAQPGRSAPQGPAAALGPAEAFLTRHEPRPGHALSRNAPGGGGRVLQSQHEQDPKPASPPSPGPGSPSGAELRPCPLSATCTNPLRRVTENGDVVAAACEDDNRYAVSRDRSCRGLRR